MELEITATDTGCVSISNGRRRETLPRPHTDEQLVRDWIETAAKYVGCRHVEIERVTVSERTRDGM
jgi:hypothetical protein